ncbi:aminoglycoside phosphotransferase [Variovorax sp. Root434]|nr:aminoglycoside phosphotransferase [Variovorax sp. Root434]
MIMTTNSPDTALDGFLVAQGLISPDEKAQWRPLAGGVSSDIWRVDIDGRSLCVKRALAQLKVEADWKAPLSRNAYEWEWMSFAAQHCPDNVPRPIAHDEVAGLFAMSFLEPDRHPVWKEQLLHGEVDPATAFAVGQVLGRLHAASAGRADVAEAFDTVDNFYALRLEPYLVAAANHHPELAPVLLELVAKTAGTQYALVHGDVSPKNILVGPSGPVLLDAECAWYGDPAFDLAFCLNHLLLKGVVRRDALLQLSASFDALLQGYLEQLNWESAERLETRAARLLPALMLARVDGKSPVEYITEEATRDLIRTFASQLLRDPVPALSELRNTWNEAVRSNARAPLP